LDIVDQAARIFDAQLGIGGDDLHLDDALGRVIADLDHVAVKVIGGFVGGIFGQALDRVDRGVAELRFKAQILVQAQHRVARLQIALDRDAVLAGGKARARKQPAQCAAGRAVGLLDDEFRETNTDIEKSLQAQAEISFKAGQESGCYAEGWASGIREVVDWVEKMNISLDIFDHVAIEGDAWQAKLKELGIDEIR
ncbi:hypothetical protein LCGC14_3001170, partial [marine sediment metagenome]